MQQPDFMKFSDQQNIFFKAIFDNAAIGIGISDLNGIPIDCNKALLDMLGYTQEEIIHHSFAEFTHPEDIDEDLALIKDLIDNKINSYTLEKRYITKFNKIIWAKLTVSLIRDASNNPQYVVAMIENITEAKKAMEELEKSRETVLDINEKLRKLNEKLEHLSLCDGLTGLNNRRSFDEYLEKEWKRSYREGKPISLILIDIDYFKRYNDTYGHQYGDAALKKVASEIDNLLMRPGDFAARYGGEEFAVILPNTDESGAEYIAEILRTGIKSLKIPNKSSKVDNFITISLGVTTMIPRKHSNLNELIGKADKALYMAKQQGRDRYSVYNINCVY
ncbi:diguanylate cyclase [Clostridium swellfunianum]|uniref:sensor domain-containing diguanylate cyclase n=1 Tax=Clostridium swellfunianum TaxID=1367462 RepID=UPI00202F54D5|nr:diguanylate cyclase [Clostridium swellfunianum]MCM0649075.1 diguanylate cyclase [Clostridium swellfunianum]